MSLEDYIKDLSPELQEKARACGSVEELVALARENKVPVPDDALAAIAGGGSHDSGGWCWDGKQRCPYCGKDDCTSKAEVHGYIDGYYCSRCDRYFY